MTPMEHRARGELLSAYRWYLRNLTRAWEPGAGQYVQEDAASEASCSAALVETLVYVLTGRSRRVTRVPTPVTRRVAA